MKTYISTLLIVLLAEAQMVQGQESLDDVFAQLDGVGGGKPAATAPAATPDQPAVDQPAAVNEAAPAAVEEEAPVVEEKEATPEINVVDSLLEKGITTYKMGELRASIQIFNAVLSLDEFNRKAISYKKRASQRIAAEEVNKRESVKEEALSDVETAWTDAPVVVPPVQKMEVKKQSLEESDAVKQMKARLQAIQIPSLDFPDASVSDVVSFLRAASGGDVNILLMGMDAEEANNTSVSLSVQNVSLYKALEYVVQMASLKFVVKADSVCIMPAGYVSPEDMVVKTFDVSPTVGSDLESASSDGGDGADDLFGGGDETASTGPADVASFFKGEVDFPDGSSATYRPRFHKLAVKNTPENINLVASVLADLEDKAMSELSQQVEIEAKFVEFQTGDLQELGFDWTVTGSGKMMGLNQRGPNYRPQDGYLDNGIVDPATGKTISVLPVSGATPTTGSNQQNLFGLGQRGNGKVFEAVKSGILSSMGGIAPAMAFGNDQIEMKIKAMQQEGTADVLSAPRVTTKSGVEAVIRIAETHRYPQDYDVETGQRTAPVVKPQDWEDFDLGVTLRVTPVVNPESNTIDLQLRPEITKFKGFDEYKVADNAYDKGGDSSVDGGDGTALYARMPYFERRFVETEVTIADGHTVVMGGLVDEVTETFRDQVPILGDIPYIGRLFRTEGSRSSKRNLVIYVKATQVDANGLTQAQRQIVRGAVAE